jgi:hypothetical protein
VTAEYRAADKPPSAYGTQRCRGKTNLPLSSGARSWRAFEAGTQAPSVQFAQPSTNSAIAIACTTIGCPANRTPWRHKASRRSGRFPRRCQGQRKSGWGQGDGPRRTWTASRRTPARRRLRNTGCRTTRCTLNACMRGATECRVSRRCPIPRVIRGSCRAPRLTMGRAQASGRSRETGKRWREYRRPQPHCNAFRSSDRRCRDSGSKVCRRIGSRRMFGTYRASLVD